jgi:hypothetical protein
MWRFVSVLGAMLMVVGCATNWVHPDPDADWDADHADCVPEAEAAGSGEIDEQAMKVCLEAKGWVEDQTSRSRQPSRSRTPRPRPRRPSRPY